MLGKHNEGEQGDKHREGTFNDEKILPVVESTLEMENAVCWDK
jgi:hypothetical protein